MRISSKGRYALVAITSMAHRYDSGEYITVLSISERFGISKIYLEQVFSLLKRAGLVNSIKGAQGGYQLAKPPSKTNVYEIFSATELSLFEETEQTVSEKSPEIEDAMKQLVFAPLDEKVKKQLQQITIEMLLSQVEKNKSEQDIMFFI
ncbi:MAG: Rrf2 family transcriptional regulator [Clostridiales bacterium]|nr:Rrf2 family transcriptional regulator [Clostridiales bacterium]